MLMATSKTAKTRTLLVGMGDDAVADVEDDFVNVESADTGAGSSEADLWVRNSPLAADHAAAGSFDSAMNLLNRQIGAVNFKPLEERFLEIYSASRTLLPANAGMAPLVNHVRRTLTETDSRRVLPIIPRDVESVISGEIVAGKNAMKANKLEDGAASFKKALHLLMVNAAASASQAEEAAAAIQSAGSYVLAMSVELERRQLIGGATDLSSFDDETKKRALELSAYFTVPTMDAQHQTLAWFSAMNFANRNKQLGSVLGFANALIERGTNAKFKETARKLKAVAERQPTDAIDVEFDTFAEFAICGASHTPIYPGGEPAVSCPFDGTQYLAKYRGTVCKVCEVCTVGGGGSGYRVVV